MSDAIDKKKLNILIIGTGMYVCGSTGEGPLLSTEEGKATAEAHIAAGKGKIPSIVQVGHNSLAEAQGLAAHAEQAGADAIAAVPPTYFKCTTVDNLVDCMAMIASAAPNTPFFYYHVPGLTGGNFDMVEFLEKGAAKMPNLAGIKYRSRAGCDDRRGREDAEHCWALHRRPPHTLLSCSRHGQLSLVVETRRRVHGYCGPESQQE